jgi:hypothetical protein
MFVKVPKILPSGKVKMTNIKADEITGFEETTCPNGHKGTKIYASGGHFKIEVDELAVAAGMVQALANNEIVTLHEGQKSPVFGKQKVKAYLNA